MSYTFGCKVTDFSVKSLYSAAISAFPRSYFAEKLLRKVRMSFEKTIV